MKGPLAAFLMALTSVWRCTGDPPPTRDTESLTITRASRGPAQDTASRTLQVGTDPEAATLVRALERCRGPEVAKFLPSHAVVAKSRDGTERTVLVRGELVKLDGVAYSCDDDIEKLLTQALGAAQAPRR